MKRLQSFQGPSHHLHHWSGPLAASASRAIRWLNSARTMTWRAAWLEPKADAASVFQARCVTKQGYCSQRILGITGYMCRCCCCCCCCMGEDQSTICQMKSEEDRLYFPQSFNCRIDPPCRHAMLQYFSNSCQAAADARGQRAKIPGGIQQNLGDATVVGQSVCLPSYHR